MKFRIWDEGSSLRFKVLCGIGFIIFMVGAYGVAFLLLWVDSLIGVPLFYYLAFVSVIGIQVYRVGRNIMVKLRNWRSSP